MAASPKRKVGRPPSGKKAYCIRMTPALYSRLMVRAKRAGFSHLGDWLEHYEGPFIRFVRQLEKEFDSDPT